MESQCLRTISYLLLAFYIIKYYCYYCYCYYYYYYYYYYYNYAFKMCDLPKLWSGNAVPLKKVARNSSYQLDLLHRPCRTFYTALAGPSTPPLQDLLHRPCRTFYTALAGPSTPPLQDLLHRPCLVLLHRPCLVLLHRPCRTFYTALAGPSYAHRIHRIAIHTPPLLIHTVLYIGRPLIDQPS